MTEYGRFTTPTIKPSPLFSPGLPKEAQETKQARRKLIEQVEQKRSENYKRFMAYIKTTGRLSA